MVERWRRKSHAEGYESKIDAVVTDVPVVRGASEHPASTLTIAPTTGEMDLAARLLDRGQVLDRPAMLVT